LVRIKKDIKYLLEIYEKLYSNNSARVDKSLELTTKALHHGDVDRIPIWQMSQVIMYPRHEIFFSIEKNLIMQLANIVQTLEHRTDYVPYLDPFEGVTVLSEAFGCPVEVPRNGDPWVKNHIIKNPEDVYDIKKPSKDSEVYKRIFDTLNFFEKETGYQMPVGVTDPQGPLDVASLIWKNDEFLVACITNKKEVHHLLNIVTEAFIEFYTMQYDMLKNPAFPVHSFPLLNSNDGISVSDDEAVLLSPDLFEEFGVPYLNRISEAFGGLYYHCCGDYGNVLDNILKIKGLRAINGHLSPKEFKPEYIDRVLSKGVGLFLGISDREIGWSDADEWTPDKIIDIYDSYYIPNAIIKSKGKGIVLVGYGSYFGYIDLPGDSGDLLVGTSGHTVDRGPLLNVPVEYKNKNFEHINNIIMKYK
jgi:hypothetical protein